MIPTTKDAFKLLLDGSLVFAAMESAGIRIDMDYLDRTEKELKVKITELESKIKQDPVWKEWKKVYKDKANLGSKDQLGHVLFNVLGYECKERTATGRPKADKATLQALDLPFLHDYRRIDKYKNVISKSFHGIRREVVDGFLHPFFNLHTVVTFRSSSDSPNFQNWDARDPEKAALVRDCFIPRKGRHLAEVDFKGIEVSVAASRTKDPVLMKYVSDSTTDMHRDTAMQLFFLEKSQVDKKTTRDWAKNRFVFPQFYGDVYFQCADYIWDGVVNESVRIPGTETSIREHLQANGIRELGDCSAGAYTKPGTFVHHCRGVESSLWNDRFRVYAAWKRKQYDYYRRKGGFRTLTGFYVHWAKGGILNKNEATNYDIQGSSHHCDLWTIIQVHRWLRKHKMKTLLTGQVHDSLIADVPDEELQDFLDKVMDVIANDLPRHFSWIKVPMVAEAEVTDIDCSWYRKRPWSRNNGIWRPSDSH